MRPTPRLFSCPWQCPPTFRNDFIVDELCITQGESNMAIPLCMVHIACKEIRGYTLVRAVTQMRSNRLVYYIVIRARDWFERRQRASLRGVGVSEQMAKHYSETVKSSEGGVLVKTVSFSPRGAPPTKPCKIGFWKITWLYWTSNNRDMSSFTCFGTSS